MKKETLFILISFALLSGRPSSSTAQSYGTELPFVLGTGARVAGMGVAGTSLDGDASLQYYNPAALSYLEWKQFSFFRSTLFDSRSAYHTVSYAHPLMKYGTVGLSVLRVDAGGIEERDNTNQLISNDLHISQTRVLLGFARQVSSMISAGFNLKIDNQSFAGFSGTGVGLDVGVTASQPLLDRFHIKGLRQGLVIHNLIQPSLKLDQEKVPDPISVALGFSALSDIRDVGLVTSIDFVKSRYSPARLRVGQEASYLNRYSLRLGVDNTSPTFGFGAKYNNMALDYAYRSEDIGNNHQISFSVRFGASLSEQRATAGATLETQTTHNIIAPPDIEQPITNSVEVGDSGLAPSEYVQEEALPDLGYTTKTPLELPFEGEWSADRSQSALCAEPLCRVHGPMSMGLGERYAYEFRMMRNGSTHRGEGTRNKDFYSSDQPIIAPAAGVVVAVENDVEDNVPGVLNRERPMGNHVIIDHGNGEYSFLSHFKKGGIVVEVGERLRTGDLLGLCGNNGHSMEPHLHYHLQNTPTFHKGRGLRVRFKAYIVNGDPITNGEPTAGQMIRREP